MRATCNVYHTLTLMDVSSPATINGTAAMCKTIVISCYNYHIKTAIRASPPGGGDDDAMDGGSVGGPDESHKTKMRAPPP